MRNDRAPDQFGNRKPGDVRVPPGGGLGKEGPGHKLSAAQLGISVWRFDGGA
jgi:hypothetical protein